MESGADLSDCPTMIPKARLTWLHSTSQYFCDTSNGGLEVGQYALQSRTDLTREGEDLVAINDGFNE